MSSTSESTAGNSSFLYVLLITAVAALGGLLFGYDTAVISGAIGFLEEHYALSSFMKGWVASSALIGCMAGVVVAGLLSDLFGRRRSLLLAALLFLVSAFGSAAPEAFHAIEAFQYTSTVGVFITFRFIGGMGVGIASIISPTYIAEVAPSRYRGGLVSLYQFAIILGMQVVYFVNYFITLQGNTAWNQEVGWRWMFGSEVIPASSLLLALFLVPESPRWLVTRERYEEAKGVLRRLFDPSVVSETFQDIRQAVQREDPSILQLLKPGLRISLVIGLVLAVLQQATGINVILYYAPEIFKKITGSGVNHAMLQTVIVGSVNLGFTLVAMWLVDRLGRRPLLMTGVSGMGASLFLFGVFAYYDMIGGWGLVFVITYIACFATSMGPVVWVVISEIFPNRIRGRAVAVASFFLWGTNYVVSQTFPMMNNNPTLDRLFNGAFPFWIYAFFCAVTLLFVYLVLPETKGKSLEEIEEIW